MYQNPPKLKDIGRTPFAQAMPEFYRGSDPIEAYRKYYAFKTTYMRVNWKLKDRIPNWWTENFIEDCIKIFEKNRNIETQSA